MAALGRLRRPPAPYGAPVIHSPANLRSAQDVSIRSLDQWCEIEVPQQDDPGAGFGGSRKPGQRFGRMRCAVGRAQGVTEQNPDNEGAFDVGGWEVELPVGIIVPDNAIIRIPAKFSLWQPLTTYAYNDIVIPQTEQSDVRSYFRCIGPGASGEDLPNWTLQQNAVLLDGDVTWTNEGSYTELQVVGSDRQQSNFRQMVVRCRELT